MSHHSQPTTLFSLCIHQSQLTMFDLLQSATDEATHPTPTSNSQNPKKPHPRYASHTWTTPKTLPPNTARRATFAMPSNPPCDPIDRPPRTINPTGGAILHRFDLNRRIIMPINRRDRFTLSRLNARTEKRKSSIRSLIRFPIEMRLCCNKNLKPP